MVWALIENKQNSSIVGKQKSRWNKKDLGISANNLLKPSSSYSFDVRLNFILIQLNFLPINAIRNETLISTH